MNTYRHVSANSCIFGSNYAYILGRVCGMCVHIGRFKACLVIFYCNPLVLFGAACVCGLMVCDVCMHMYAYVCVCRDVSMYMYACVCVCSDVCMYIYAYMCVCAHTHSTFFFVVSFYHA